MNTREIKFRGKNITTGEWVFGSLVNNLWNYTESHSLSGQNVCEIIVSGECDNYEDMESRELNVTVIPETVGQFTGLKDDAGLSIYEGDIVVDIKGTSLSVEWNDDTCKFQFSDGTDINDKERYATYKRIIGNIYEHPELLKHN